MTNSQYENRIPGAENGVRPDANCRFDPLKTFFSGLVGSGTVYYAAHFSAPYCVAAGTSRPLAGGICVGSQEPLADSFALQSDLLTDGAMLKNPQGQECIGQIWHDRNIPQSLQAKRYYCHTDSGILSEEALVTGLSQVFMALRNARGQEMPFPRGFPWLLAVGLISRCSLAPMAQCKIRITPIPRKISVFRAPESAKGQHLYHSGFFVKGRAKLRRVAG